MSELMIMQNEYINWLNESKLHQCLPFIALSTMTVVCMALFTEIKAIDILVISYNPFSFGLYWLVGVTSFTTIPVIVTFLIIYLFIISIRKLKKV